MRTLGFLLLLLGVFIAYLGIRGKVGRAWMALRDGVDPGVIQGIDSYLADKVNKGTKQTFTGIPNEITPKALEMEGKL